MLGTIVNTGAVILGGGIGLILKKGIPERFKTIYFQAIGLFTLAIGVSMVWDMQNILIIVASLGAGSMIGEWLNIEKGIEKLSEWLKRKTNINEAKFSEGLITSFLLFCMGSMSIVGAIQEGTTGNNDLLLTKSLMDGFSAVLLASAFGIGVIFSALPLFIFQGAITLLAVASAKFFTPEIINGISAIGGILMIGLGINILDIKKLRIMNMLPSLIIVVILLWIF